MKQFLIPVLVAAAMPLALAKLPAPDDAAKAKAAEAAAKAAWQAKVDAYQLCLSQDRVAAPVRKAHGLPPLAAPVKAAAAAPAPAKPAASAAAPAKPAASAAAPAKPASAPAAPASAPAVVFSKPGPCVDPGPFVYTPPAPAAGASAPAAPASAKKA